MRGFRTITASTTDQLNAMVQAQLAEGEGWRVIQPNKPPEQQTRPDTGLVEYLVYLIQD